MHIRGLAVPQPRRRLALYSSLIPFCFKPFPRSLPNALLAFAILTVTSSSMYTALERALPRLVNLSTTCSLCQFTSRLVRSTAIQVQAGILTQFLC